MEYESLKMLRIDYVPTHLLRNRYVMADKIPKRPQTVLYDLYRHMTSSKLLRFDYVMTHPLRYGRKVIKMTHYNVMKFTFSWDLLS